MNLQFFDLSVPKPGEDNPKVYKISNELFKKSWTDFPQSLAERMVELGYGKWVPVTATGGIPVTQQFIFPEQIIFIRLKTHAVKACHVNTLIPNNGNVPNNLELYAENLIEDVWFRYDSIDLLDAAAYEELCEEYDTEGAVDLTEVEPEVVEKVVEEAPIEHDLDKDGAPVPNVPEELDLTPLKKAAEEVEEAKPTQKKKSVKDK